VGNPKERVGLIPYGRDPRRKREKKKGRKTQRDLNPALQTPSTSKRTTTNGDCLRGDSGVKKTSGVGKKGRTAMHFAGTGQSLWVDEQRGRKKIERGAGPGI